MKLDAHSIEQLALVIIGDIIDKNKPDDYDGYMGLTLNKTGRNLVELFNDYGYRDVYNAPGVQGLPDNLSKKNYTIKRLTELNDTKNMEKLINNFMFSRNYIDTDCDVNNIANYINERIKYDGYKLELVGGEYIVTGDGLIADETVEVEPTFEDIQNKIISEIRNAKYTIWVAVAWFTDNVILNELIEKKKQGVNVQIIVCNDRINSAINFENYFETRRINEFGAYGNNIFHNKFCVIDLETVIHGSYNWSKRAQYNKEDITTVKSIEFAKQYADRFIELKLMQ